jgi:hypothetical protein
MPTGGRDALKMVNAINQLHQQSFTRLAGPIPSDEFSINGILRRLCISRDRESNGVLGV